MGSVDDGGADDGGTDGGGTGTGQDSSGAGTDDGPGTSDGADSSDSGDGSAGDSEGTTGSGGTGVCAQGCEEAAECCSLGAVGCPGENYPDNWTCSAEGVCEFGGCDSDDDCPIPGFECHPIASVGTCFDPCVNDQDCVAMPGTTCTGVADDSVEYCHEQPEPCQDNADCNDAGVCDEDSGECVCHSDADCNAAGADTCVQ